MGTMMIAFLVTAGVILAFRSICRTRKSGKLIQCGEDCSRCRGCH